MCLRGHTADHRFRELALSLMISRGPLVSSKAVNQLETRQAIKCMPHLALSRTEEGRRSKRNTIFPQSRRQCDVKQCKSCKSFKVAQGKQSESKQPMSHCTVHRSKAPHDQPPLSAARSTRPKKSNNIQETGGARPDYSDYCPRDMEDTLQDLQMMDIKEEEIRIAQVDGLVDYSSSEEEDSDKMSTGEPHIWEVPDSKTWVLSQLDKLRQHENYDKIIHYRDDGDDKWHKRMASVLNAMTLNNIECGDLYNDRPLQTPGILKNSNPSYPEWGIIDSIPPSIENKAGEEQKEVTADDTPINVTPSTLPPMCEMEPEIMTDKKLRDDSPPKRVTKVDTFRSKYYGDNPEIVIVKNWCQEEEKMAVYYMVKGAKLDENSSNEEYHDHYKTVVEALKKYGRPYRHKMENDFWRIKGKMTQEEMKNHVLEFWSSGDLVRHNPFLNRNLWGRTENWNETGVKWERKRGGYDQEGKNGAILMDLCEEEA